MSEVNEKLETKKTKDAGFSDKVHLDLKAKDHVIKLMKEQLVEFVDLRFTDLRGKEHHVTLQDKIDDSFYLWQGL